jgi:hypothetical protein
MPQTEAGTAVAVDAGTGMGRQAGNVDQVLDRERHAREPAAGERIGVDRGRSRPGAPR